MIRGTFSPDGRLVATASSDTTVRLWDAATGKSVRVLEGHTGAVRPCRASPEAPPRPGRSANGSGAHPSQLYV